jgi:carbamate kinase
MTRPPLVIALGGNALSPPRGDQSYAAERDVVARAARTLAKLAAGDRRLLLVHGNGPQVGRLLREGADPRDLDVHVAQTQGELGYLLAEGLECHGAAPAVALVTRVTVDPEDAALAIPVKPIGPVLRQRPVGATCAVEGGWRRLVASPHPVDILDTDAIATLLATHHVVAGGGGGIALTCAADGRRRVPGVIDKDRVAARLAIAVGADRLVFATDVAGAETGHGTAAARVLSRLTVAEARTCLAAGEFGAGSMAPKIESACEFVAATGRPAIILHVDALAAALDDAPPGTYFVPPS